MSAGQTCSASLPLGEAAAALTGELSLQRNAVWLNDLLPSERAPGSACRRGSRAWLARRSQATAIALPGIACEPDQLASHTQEPQQADESASGAVSRSGFVELHAAGDK